MMGRHIAIMFSEYNWNRGKTQRAMCLGHVNEGSQESFETKVRGGTRKVQKTKSLDEIN